VISNSHAAETAGRLGVPLLRAGFPQYDLIGGYQRCGSAIAAPGRRCSTSPTARLSQKPAAERAAADHAA
jgi:hypothetical protein